MSKGQSGVPLGQGLGILLLPPSSPYILLEVLTAHTRLRPQPGFLSPPIPVLGASHQQFLVLGLEFTVLLLRIRPRTRVRVGGAGRSPSSPGSLLPLPPGTHLGEVGPDGLDLIVKDVVLLHLVVHQRQFRPEALAAQRVLAREAGARHTRAWARGPQDSQATQYPCPGNLSSPHSTS